MFGGYKLPYSVMWLMYGDWLGFYCGKKQHKKEANFLMKIFYKIIPNEKQGVHI